MRSDLVLYIALGVLATATVALMWNDDAGATLGVDNSSFASFVYLGTLMLVIGAGIVTRARFGPGMLMQIAIWLAIFVALTIGYRLFNDEPVFPEQSPPDQGGITASVGAPLEAIVQASS